MVNRTINKDSILHQVSSDMVTSKTNDLFRYFVEEYWGVHRAGDTIRSPKFKKFLSDRFNAQDLSSIADFIKCIGESSKTGQFPPDDDSFSLSEVYLKLVMNQSDRLIDYLALEDYQTREAIESPKFKEFLSARFSTKDLANIAVFLKCIIESSKTGQFPSDDDSFSLSEENISEEDQDEKH